ncbi:MAG: CHAP domain-containing protein, partial [Nocardioides sp.]
MKSPVRHLVQVVAVVALVVASFVGVAPAAQAGTTVDAHNQYGYPYPNAPDCNESSGANCAPDAWNFYQGQCTSWVAFRLNQLNGIGFTNRYRGVAWGNASNWGAAARSLGIAVDGAPALGAVAWYSAGHVGYVEQVNGDGSVVMSEMNQNFHNNFQLVTIRPGSRWPTGFIHIADRPTTTGNPIGSFDGLTRAPGGADVRGWVLDPDTSASTQAHLYGGDGSVNAANYGVALGADQSRPDVAAAYPGYGDAPGFAGRMGLPPGNHTVCLYGINVAGPGANPRLDCKSILIDPNPYGHLDSVVPLPGGVAVAGWAIDPDTGGPTDVHSYGGSGEGNPSINPGVATTADLSRSDVAAVYPAYGELHGFNTGLALPAGQHTVCAYGINAAGTAGLNQALGCHGVTVPERLRPSITVKAPDRARPGATIRIRGALHGMDGSETDLELQRRVSGGKWQRVTRWTEASEFTLKVRFRRTARFRVVAAAGFTHYAAASP